MPFSATGRDPVSAAIAKNALEMAAKAQTENRQVRGPDTPREQTVNRAFSRRFFQALETGAKAPAVGPAFGPSCGHDGADISAPAMLLDEADLLDASEMEDIEALDESDLIPT